MGIGTNYCVQREFRVIPAVNRSYTVISDELGAKRIVFLGTLAFLIPDFSWHTKEFCHLLTIIKFKMNASSNGFAPILVPHFVKLQDTLGQLQHSSYSPATLMQPSSDSPLSSPTESKPHSLSPAPDTSLSHSESYTCQWVDCSSTFTDPEVLYNHLCNDHIGRKSTNNLCLTCKWKDCGTSCAKRDHITSHLRGTYTPLLLKSPFIRIPPLVHTPLKPHVCEVRLDCFPVYHPSIFTQTVLRYARSHSSVHRISKSTRKFIQRSIMHSTSTQRQLP